MSRQKEIYQELQSLSDPKYKEFHGGLVPGEENLLGVRLPVCQRAFYKVLRARGYPFAGDRLFLL